MAKEKPAKDKAAQDKPAKDKPAQDNKPSKEQIAKDKAAKKEAKEAAAAAAAAPAQNDEPAGPKRVPHLREVYQQKVVPQMREKFGYSNPMQVPRLQKIVLNMGVGEGARDIKTLETAEHDLGLISGQKPRRNKARVSVAAFKVREGMPVGCSVTLRAERMWDFLQRLIFVALPRVRDFRGLPPNAFDGRGNYSLGIREHIIFTEIDLGKIANIRGLNIVFCTSAKTDEEARALLEGLGFPLRKR
jgi:large subunit ribosomal protein L5